MTKTHASRFGFRTRLACVLASTVSAACGAPPADPASVSLTGAIDVAMIADTPEVAAPAPVVWDFSTGAAPGTVDEPMLGAVAVNEVQDLELRDGLLRGTTTGDRATIAIPVAEDASLEDRLHAVELRMRISGGSLVAMIWGNSEKLDIEEIVDWVEETNVPPPLNAPVVAGNEMHTYTLSTTTVPGSGPRLGRVRRLLVFPAREAGVEFAIESIRLISRREHLQTIPSGVSWQGLGEIYRETLVTRTPERASFPLQLPSDPWMDLHVGMIEPGAATFTIGIEENGGEIDLLQRTVTTADRWEQIEIDLSEWAGRSVTVHLRGTATQDGTLLYWGGPIVRARGDALRTARATEARSALTAAASPPRRILFILADTLRRDRLPWYGGERDNAPVLARIAEEGTVFTRNVSQGTWTKVSVPSILTSLYPTSHGIVEVGDRLPSSVTTLAESLQDAGYATYATSSVPFTGKLSALHQGVETLHEVFSIDDLPHSSSKTARTYVDRLLPWIDEHAETPFFVFLHVFDPHDPFRPYAPYDTLYADEAEITAHEDRVEKVKEFLAEEEGEEVDDGAYDPLPSAEQLEGAGVDAEAYVNVELDWYDGSIRGMDAEIGRVLERLEQLDLLDDTLIVFMSDHGEEFLEHGRHFHGMHAYGEMLNVPLMLWWPGTVPAGRSDELVQSIDVFPTVLELAGLAVPTQAQGQSLVPLMADPERPSRFGWVARPAFAERAITEELAWEQPTEDQVAQQVIVADGWKLVRNVQRPEGRAEFELYDYLNDPLDQDDVAADHPEVVEGLAEELAAWHERALADRIEEVSAEDMSPEELQRLRSLGYIQ